ncbi:MAG: type IV toxin-antitoxin system AbiEi family antitoxin domain-containing protein [Gemmatimonadaceae bacterium]
MPSKWQRAAYEIADGQQGYFTMAQAVAAGVPAIRLPDMLRRGVVERISRGVYRLVDYPRPAAAQLVEATLWPSSHHDDIRGVLSHESALAFHEISDVSPAHVHITLPKGLRIRRAVPKYLRIHRADLDPADVEWHEGLPVTTAARTIRDCHEAHLGPALLRQAIEDGRQRGVLTTREADALAEELLNAIQAEAPTASR